MDWGSFFPLSPPLTGISAGSLLGRIVRNYRYVNHDFCPSDSSRYHKSLFSSCSRENCSFRIALHKQNGHPELFERLFYFGNRSGAVVTVELFAEKVEKITLEQPIDVFETMMAEEKNRETVLTWTDRSPLEVPCMIVGLLTCISGSLSFSSGGQPASKGIEFEGAHYRIRC